MGAGYPEVVLLAEVVVVLVALAFEAVEVGREMGCCTSEGGPSVDVKLPFP